MVSSEVGEVLSFLQVLSNKSGAEACSVASAPRSSWLSPFRVAPHPGSSCVVEVSVAELGKDTQSSSYPRPSLCCTSTTLQASLGATFGRVKGGIYIYPYNRKVRFDFSPK